MCFCSTMNRIDLPHLVWALESLVRRASCRPTASPSMPVPRPRPGPPWIRCWRCPDAVSAPDAVVAQEDPAAPPSRRSRSSSSRAARAGRPRPARKRSQPAATGRQPPPAGRRRRPSRQAKEQRRQKAQAYREAMIRGDVSQLPPRETGAGAGAGPRPRRPARNFGPVFLALLLANFASSLAQSLGIRVLFTYLLMLGLVRVRHRRRSAGPHGHRPRWRSATPARGRR